MMTDQSQTPGFQAPVMAQDLSPAQRSLVELMHVHQFGRIENMSVRDGQPILDSTVNVVRVARLGDKSNWTKLGHSECELKSQVRELFAELMRLRNGTVIRLEFRHGLPFLVETAATVSS
jgi:hypothetical protein